MTHAIEKGILHERHYFLQRTVEGPILVLIKSRPDDAVGASLQYDGRDHALFLRKPREAIVLDYISPTIQQDLLNAPFVEMIEVAEPGEDIRRDYRVTVHPVKELFIVGK